MTDVFDDLYSRINGRKSKSADLEPYLGGNGRVDRCVQLVRQRKLPCQGTLLDVGGAIGDLGYALRDDFKNGRYVIDISEIHRAANEAKGNVFIRANVDTEGFVGIYDGSIDLITALDFIEHIIDPERFARECHRALNKNGAVFINTPNIRFWGCLQALVIGGYFPHTSGDTEVFHGGHVAFFTRGDLETIFHRAGFHGFVQVRDDEGFKRPPDMWLNMLPASFQRDLLRNVEELGNPNLLFIAKK